MRILKSIDNLPIFNNAVVTIGSYDGFHVGHRKILNRVKQIAQDYRGESVLVTFDPHPRKLLQGKDSDLQLLTTLDKKIDLLSEAGLENLVIVPFDEEFAGQSAEAYITDFLVDRFKPAVIVVGYDHKFGKDRAGDIELLRSMAPSYGYDVIEIAKKEIEDIAISSTKTRNALKKGEVTLAHEYLNRPYSITGKVISGDKIGRSIGFPTANLQVDNSDKLIPGDGIYAIDISIDKMLYQGMLYIGSRPTIDQKSERKIEVNIFDFDQDIYDQYITIHLLHKIREDERFDSVEELRLQLIKDRESSLIFFKSAEDKNTSTPESPLPKVSIAILNYNGEELLESYLPKISYSSEKYDYEVVVIDNASSDGSLDYIKEWHPEVRIIETGSNLGFSGGYNYGMDQIDSLYTVILNSDVLVTENWLDPVIDTLEKDSSVGAVQPKILSLEEREKFEYAGAAGGFIDTLGYPYCRGRIFDQLEHDNGQYDEEIDIQWASGAALVLKTDLYKELGGLDEDFFAHMEEIDLCWRLRRAGYKIKVVPSSTVYHLGGGTLNYNNPKKVFLNFRNALYLLVKNEPMPHLLWKLFLRLSLDAVSFFRFLLQGNTQAAFQVLKSHFSFYGGLPGMISKRRKIKGIIKQCKSGNNVEVDTVFSIVLDHFIKGINSFSQLSRTIKS